MFSKQCRTLSASWNEQLYIEPVKQNQLVSELESLKFKKAGKLHLASGGGAKQTMNRSDSVTRTVRMRPESVTTMSGSTERREWKWRPRIEMQGFIGHITTEPSDSQFILRVWTIYEVRRLGFFKSKRWVITLPRSIETFLTELKKEKTDRSVHRPIQKQKRVTSWSNTKYINMSV